MTPARTKRVTVLSVIGGRLLRGHDLEQLLLALGRPGIQREPAHAAAPRSHVDRARPGGGCGIAKRSAPRTGKAMNQLAMSGPSRRTLGRRAGWVARTPGARARKARDSAARALGAANAPPMPEVRHERHERCRCERYRCER